MRVAGSETEALAAIDAVDADLYSLAQPDVAGGAETGEPNTFLWAYNSPASATVSSQSTATSGGTSAEEYDSSLTPTGTMGSSPSPRQ